MMISNHEAEWRNDVDIITVGTLPFIFFYA